MSEGRQNSCSDTRLRSNKTETGANLMERQCRCRCRMSHLQFYRLLLLRNFIAQQNRALKLQM